MLFDHAERARIRGETIRAIQSGAVDVDRLAAQLRGFLAQHRDDPDGDPAWVDATRFKRERVGIARDVVRRFRTAGRRGQGRGEVEVSAEGMATMRAAIVESGREMVFGERQQTRVLALGRPPVLARDCLMTHCMEVVIDDLGAPGSRFLVTAGGLDVSTLTAELRWAEAAGPPLTLLGPRHALVAILERYASAGMRFWLPRGSRLVDTGVVLGRHVPRGALIAAAARTFGLLPQACVSVMGMTELASQFYEPAWRDQDPTARWFEAPPWVRTSVVDPTTLRPLPAGEVGRLVHCDLAILDRPFVVLTDDVGRLLPPTEAGRSRFELLDPQP